MTEVIARGQDRELGGVERLFAWNHDLGGATHVVAAQIGGPVEVEHLKIAMQRVQRRHPVLTARIVERAGRWWLALDGAEAPVVVERDERPWGELFEAQIHTRFEAAQGPLWGIKITGEAEEPWLVMSLHHAVEDGRSTLTILGELLEDCRRLRAGLELEAAAPGRVWPAVESMLGGRLTWRVKLRFLFREIGRLLIKPTALVEVEAPFEARRTRCGFRRLGEAATGSLVARCRAEGTTVQGALSAAMLLAMAGRLDRGRPVWMSCDANVDMRGWCEPAAPVEAVGMMIGSVSWAFKVEKSMDLWGLAREVRGRLGQVIERGDPRDNMLLIDWARLTREGLERVAREGSGRQQAVFVSNLGRGELKAEGPLATRQFYYSAGQHGMGASLWVGALTVGGCLNLTFSWAEPLVSAASAEAMIEDVLVKLGG